MKTKMIAVLVLLLSLMVWQPAMADAIPNLATMLGNLSKTIPDLMRLVTALGYVVGFFLVIKGVIEFKHFGESRQMMSKEHGVMKPISYLFIGAALIYLPSTVQTGISTFWTETSPLVYVPQADDSWAQLVKQAFLIFQLIGVIALIRGLIMLSHIGGHGGGGQATVGKAMTHIIGGIFCINMYAVVTTIWATLGMGVT